MTDLTPETLEKIAEFANRGAFAHKELVAANSWPRHFLVVPDGTTAQDITAEMDARLVFPVARRGSLTLASVDSLIAMALRMREPSSVLFAETTTLSLRVVFDFHDAVNLPGPDGALSPNPAALPAHGAFTAGLALRTAPQFDLWLKASLQPLPQPALAALIEERALDLQLPETVADPAVRAILDRLGISLASPADVIAFARRAGVIVRETFGQTGETEPEGESSYLRTVELPRAVPSAFLIAVPVFENDAAYQFLVRVRMVREEKSVLWSLILPRLDEARKDAFRVTAERVAKETGLPLFVTA